MYNRPNTKNKPRSGPPSSSDPGGEKPKQPGDGADDAQDDRDRRDVVHLARK
jgi:hypothetical protein